MSVLAFGDDRSDGADTCWGWIASQNWQGWDLEVVTAEAPADMHPVGPEEAELHVWEPDAARDASGAGFASVTHLRASVDPRLALISKTWDLVAIGPRGTGFLKNLHVGSTADWLLREPTSPLVIAREPEQVTRVLVADDGSSHAQRAVETLQSFPWLAGTEVRVVTVDDGKVDAGAGATTADRLASTGAKTDSVVRKGNPTRALLAEVGEWKPDLVVMGARGHSGMKRLVVGSSTATVTSGTSCSVLVAHATES